MPWSSLLVVHLNAVDDGVLSSGDSRKTHHDLPTGIGGSRDAFYHCFILSPRSRENVEGTEDFHTVHGYVEFTSARPRNRVFGKVQTQ